jgi:hypothetical protein
VSTTYTPCQLLRERPFLAARIDELERNMDFYLDRNAAVRELEGARMALTAVDVELVALDLAARPPTLADPKFDLTPEQAASHLGIDKRELVRLVGLTPSARWPCIDLSLGGVRRHLRFNKSQLENWAKEKPWQASVLTRTAGSSGGGSPPTLTLVPGSSGPGSAPSQRPAPRSIARKPSAPRTAASLGFRPTGDPDLDGLV